MSEITKADMGGVVPVLSDGMWVLQEVCEGIEIGCRLFTDEVSALAAAREEASYGIDAELHERVAGAWVARGRFDRYSAVRVGA